MVVTLKDLTLQQCSQLGHGHETYGDPKILKCGFTHVEARILGSLGYYKVTISIRKGRVVTDCTCPMGGGCKHVRETAIEMYYKLRTMNAARLTPKRLYKESLLKKSREELIDLLMDKWSEENDDDDDDDNEDEEEEEDSIEDYEYYHDSNEDDEEEEEDDDDTSNEDDDEEEEDDDDDDEEEEEPHTKKRQRY
ncbi:hypothetical protein PPL_05292 [Heterostelium album PN500]|uniref:SWIM-type domain-containing protein n=1 Tax=Heterostelium pallidum (strain ATCC 26659 / Pp 5 / PN500) TaxID=670386 RepID=D3BBA5_HETP5|nr:hypothetical protein PPL_05292 [Heterostelium album PN500]EFA81312.1 hypothetical protein PPL_05292 [Heterostelium album PN500]|eukprot:XP_020433430.1 hypothetical protein PPL_05292 [Heterostelium album PN500]